MNHDTYTAALEAAIEKTHDAYTRGGTRSITPDQLTQALRHVANQIAPLARNYWLTSLRTVDDLAAEFGVEKRRAQAIAKAQNAKGYGQKIGDVYIFADDELEAMRPRPHAGRPPKATKSID